MNRAFLTVSMLIIAVATAHADETLVVATWNIGLLDRSVADLELTEFQTEIDADVLVLNEVQERGHVDAFLERLGRAEDARAISRFSGGSSDLEVAIISRHPLTEVIEFDRSPENNQTTPTQEKLERVPLQGIADIGVGRGFLAARIPALNLFIIATHLKSSLGDTGAPDRDNARKRELVAAAIAEHVHDLMAKHPDHTIVVAGDMNVGVSDAAKNGTILTEDAVSGPGDRYDETHALLTRGLVDGLRMRNLAEGLAGTYVGDDNVPDFPGSGAIDVIYVVGPAADRFAKARRASTRYGSDHLAVYTRYGDSGVEPQRPTPNLDAVRIVRVLPNPEGQDAGRERITVENTAEAFSPNGWAFSDSADNRFILPADTVFENGQTVIVLETNSMPLNNTGDTIRLFNQHGAQIGPDCAYTENQVAPSVEIECN